MDGNMPTSTCGPVWEPLCDDRNPLGEEEFNKCALLLSDRRRHWDSHY